ncbi:MAG: DUF6600 domain-containing protein [Polyangiales bacterium]
MLTRTRLTLALAFLALSQGCVVYRDRIITVSQRTEIEVRGAAPANRLATVSLGSVPARLDGERIEAALAGYGRWVEDPTYGMIWVPGRNSGGGDRFVPYVTDGRWVSTTAGWFWQSDLPWGAVAFHYGRWVNVSAGWAWVPGSTFAPAWVDWRSGAGWVGWAPLAPAGAAYVAPFVYCSAGALAGAGLAGRVVAGSGASSLYARTAPIDARPGHGGAVYSHGPAVGAGQSIASVGVSDAWSDAVRATPRVGVPDEGGRATRAGVPLDARVLPDRVASIPSALEVPRPTSGGATALYADATDLGASRGGFSVVRDATGTPRLGTISLGSTHEIPTASHASSPSAPPSFAARDFASVPASPSRAGYVDAPRALPTLPPAYAATAPRFSTPSPFVANAPSAFGSTAYAPTPSYGGARAVPSAPVTPLVARAPASWAAPSAPTVSAAPSYNVRAAVAAPRPSYVAPAPSFAAPAPARGGAFAAPVSPMVQSAPRLR